jgi:hypothetical protein
VFRKYQNKSESLYLLQPGTCELMDEWTGMPKRLCQCRPAVKNSCEVHRALCFCLSRFTQPTGNQEGCSLFAKERENCWKKLEMLARWIFFGTDIQWTVAITEPQGTRFFFCRMQIPFNGGIEIKDYRDFKRFRLKTWLLPVQVPFNTGFTLFSDIVSENAQKCIRYLIQRAQQLDWNW